MRYQAALRSDFARSPVAGVAEFSSRRRSPQSLWQAAIGPGAAQPAGTRASGERRPQAVAQGFQLDEDGVELLAQRVGGRSARRFHRGRGLLGELLGLE